MNDFDITYLENALVAILRGCNIASGVYTNRPKAKTNEDAFVVVSVTGKVEDDECFGTCRVYVSLYAKDLADIKNSKKLSVMYQKLIEGFPMSYDYSESSVVKGQYLFDKAPQIVGDKADGYGYHARVVVIETTIKVI